MTNRSVLTGSRGPKSCTPHRPSADTEPSNPTRTNTAPITNPVSRVIMRNNLFSRGSSGSKPAVIAKILAKLAQLTAWNTSKHAHGGCLYDELRGKLHTGSSQIHPFIDGFSKAAHAAVGVSDICAEKQFQDSRKHGVADVLMMPSHRARFDFSFEAIAHHNFIA